MGFLTGSNLGIRAFFRQNENTINDVIEELFSSFCAEKQIPCLNNTRRRKDVCNNCPIYSANWSELTMYDVADRAIRDAFDNRSRCATTASAILTKELILNRLLIIDTWFPSQKEKGYYIQRNMAEAIWNACDDGIGTHSDEILAIKANNYISWIRASKESEHAQEIPPYVKDIENLLCQRFTWVENTKDNARCELSLMTRYLHYLVETVRPDNTEGFPTYDVAIRSVIPMVYFLIGELAKRKAFDSDFDFDDAIPGTIVTMYRQYVRILGNIADCLRKDIAGLTTFHILGDFLWHCGKVYGACVNTESPTYEDLWILVTEAEFVHMRSNKQLNFYLKKLEKLVRAMELGYKVPQNHLLIKL